MRGISDAEAEAIIIIERTCSGFSLIGCVFVLVTFSFSPAFRQRAINRMVFLATFGNMFTNVATLMTRSYTGNVDSFGCQLQSFLIQVFMQGDAYWALAMAINVYLTFYHKYDARALRRMEIPYLLCCYGIPFIPGFTFLFVRNQSGRPYGNAVLWCWLKPEWEVYRIATFYGPVWVAIIITMAIYIRAGREIFKKRRKMLNFSGSGTGTGGNGGHGNEVFATADLFTPVIKTTEVIHTTELVQKTVPSTSAIPEHPAPIEEPNISYSVTISADAKANERDSLDGMDDMDLDGETTAASIQSSNTITNDSSSPNPNSPSSTSPNPRIRVNPSSQNVPSAANILQARRRFQRTMEAHNATWSYTKCAILFFSALLITWIPSSGNRVYSMINHGDVNKPLFFASAFVLPLQGFWNAIIYIVTSWAACKSFWGTVSAGVMDICSGGGCVGARARRRRTVIAEITAHAVRAKHHRDTARQAGVGMGKKWGKDEETTSMEDLTGARAERAERVSPV
ncbi:hypothetical protein B0T25DRAFT_634228 [Lasiosphaeria hispida]|uniref:G-protein coupled receptors family 2 profile 2 domain-containing protein n=1 Tax=Lasiosphaeria hispida TaxID=260671 RepID=A0AAJ0HC67_9PEZI|nr:hypothetical protein B0T25DRAFT_634228 [Lasiosphaeria hispida]